MKPAATPTESGIRRSCPPALTSTRISIAATSATVAAKGRHLVDAADTPAAAVDAEDVTDDPLRAHRNRKDRRGVDERRAARGEVEAQDERGEERHAPPGRIGGRQTNTDGPPGRSPGSPPTWCLASCLAPKPYALPADPALLAALMATHPTVSAATCPNLNGGLFAPVFRARSVRWCKSAFTRRERASRSSRATGHGPGRGRTAPPGSINTSYLRSMHQKGWLPPSGDPGGHPTQADSPALGLRRRPGTGRHGRSSGRTEWRLAGETSRSPWPPPWRPAQLEGTGVAG